jgi:hypothetical protein
MTGYQSKRAMAQDKLAQPEQEPVGFVDSKLNPIQRTWVGLTQEEVRDMFQRMYDASVNWPTFAAAIEAKLKERNA